MASVGKMALVVEDNVLNKNLVSTILEGLEYTVVSASDGDAALDLIEKHPGIELIVTDIFMPKKEGIGFMRAVRARHKQVKIIGMTGAVNFTTISTTGMEFGADLMIKKPFDIDEFAEKVQQLMSTHRCSGTT